MGIGKYYILDPAQPKTEWRHSTIPQTKSCGSTDLELWKLEGTQRKRKKNVVDRVRSRLRCECKEDETNEGIPISCFPYFIFWSKYPEISQFFSTESLLFNRLMLAKSVFVIVWCSDCSSLLRQILCTLDSSIFSNIPRFPSKEINSCGAAPWIRNWQSQLIVLEADKHPPICKNYAGISHYLFPTTYRNRFGIVAE